MITQLNLIQYLNSGVQNSSTENDVFNNSKLAYLQANNNKQIGKKKKNRKEMTKGNVRKTHNSKLSDLLVDLVELLAKILDLELNWKMITK